jgi:hypothetical protein
MDRYLPIADHGLVGDLHTAALVGVEGTIDYRKALVPGRDPRTLSVRSSTTGAVEAQTTRFRVPVDRGTRPTVSKEA